MALNIKDIADEPDPEFLKDIVDQIPSDSPIEKEVNKMTKVFEIQYQCRNCGNLWKEKYEKGDEITGGIFQGVHFHSHKCTGDYSCKHCGPIKCPICESKKISIKKRQPLGQIR